MRLRLKWVGTSIATAIALACTDDTPALDASLVVVDGTISVDEHAARVSLQLAASLLNTGTNTLSFETCTLRLQHDSGVGWEDTWTPGCPLLTNPSVVSPNTVTQLDQTIRALIAPSPNATWLSPTVGEFRLLLPVASIDGSASLVLISNRFRLSE